MTAKRSMPVRPIAYGRLFWGAAAVLGSVVLTYFFGGALSNDPNILGVIASIFSILAGVLIAVISILGDPSMLLDQSWRHSYLSAEETQRKIHRQTDVFMIYVLLLISLFAFMLCSGNASYFWWLQRITFFLTALAFFASLSLPFTLRSIQRKRLDRAIQQIRSSKQAS